MMKSIGTLVLTLLVLAGCATAPRETKLEAGTAVCCVCQHNNDLACLKVKVTEATPKAEYDGRTYCFCSEDCRKSFQKTPRKYATH